MIDHAYGHLSSFERAVLEKFLTGDHAVLRELRRQLDVAQVIDREMTGVGFFTRLHVPATHAMHVGSGKTIHLSDVIAELAGLEHGAGFVLYVTNGTVAALEGFTYDEPWPDTIRSFELAYANDEMRDLAELSSLTRS